MDRQSNWGGHRPGSGRKPRTDGRKCRVVIVLLTEEEHKRIKATSTPDSRRELLLSEEAEKCSTTHTM